MVNKFSTFSCVGPKTTTVQTVDVKAICRKLLENAFELTTRALNEPRVKSNPEMVVNVNISKLRRNGIRNAHNNSKYCSIRRMHFHCMNVNVSSCFTYN